MKVFVTGATGYIGLAVAQAFRRAGHSVWGLVRDERKAGRLMCDEIVPLNGSIDDPGSYAALAEHCSVLVHCAADMGPNWASIDRKVIETFIGAAHRSGQRKRVLYTSGAWVYGNTNGLADETSSLQPPSVVQWRPEHERMVLEASGIHGLVVRPGCVYGKRAGLTAAWFKTARDGHLTMVGDGKNHWTMVHVDDLADGYLRLAESGLSGEIFNFTDRSRHTVLEMAEAVARITGYHGDIRTVQPTEPLMQAMALDQHVDSRKAVRLLGWQPRHGGFVDDVEKYYLAWKAATEA